MEGQYDEAERIYLRLHQHNRNDEEVLYLIGVLCCDLGIFQQACRFLEQAQKLNPQFPEAAQQLVVALKGQAGQDMEAGKFALAEAGLRRAQKLAPNNDDCLLMLGRAAMLRSNFALAESLLSDFLRRAPDHAQALNWHGLACLQQKKLAAAEQSLRRALAANPKQSQVRNNLGISLYEQGRLAEAHDCFLTALIHDPSYARARQSGQHAAPTRPCARSARAH